MAVTPKFSIPESELRRLNRELANYAATAAQDMKDVVRDEARLLVRDLTNLTPPRARGTGNIFKAIAPQSQRKAGEQAVENDVRRMFQPLKGIEAIYDPQSKKFAKEVRILLRTRDYKALGQLLFDSEILPFKPVIIEEVDPGLHKRFRQPSTGRVSKRVKNPWLVVRERSIETYINKLKGRVGFGKSGWSKSLRGSGLAVPRWIDKGGSGTYRRQEKRATLEITMGNSVPYMQRRADEILGEAVRNRIKSLANRSKAIADKAARKR